MTNRPWYRRFGQDFVFGTMGMSLEQRGAYSILLDLIYDRGGPLPNDDSYFAGVMGITKARWRRLRDELIALGKISLEDGMISNPRADSELAEQAEFSRERAESGRRGGQNRAENAQKTNEKRPKNEQKTKNFSAKPKPDSNENKDLEKAQLKPFTSYSHNHSVSPPITPPIETDPFEAWWRAYPRGRKRGKGKARQTYLEIIKNGRAPPETLLLGAMRLAAALGDDHPFVPMPQTWLNQERWTDDDIADPPESAKNGASDHDLRRKIAGAVARNLDAERADAGAGDTSDAAGDQGRDGAGAGASGHRDGGDPAVPAVLSPEGPG